MPVAIMVTIDIVQTGAGAGGVLAGGPQANQPGYGQSQYAGIVGNSQTMRLSDMAQVPGTPGQMTLANINTALTTAVSDLAGSTGAPLITPAILATINAWNSGSP